MIELDIRSKNVCLISKVNFEKVYNSISWSFMNYMLIRFVFNKKLKASKRACMFVGNLPVMVNGYQPQMSSIQKSLKQGVPLTFFLFLLVVEGLSDLVDMVK